MKQPLRAIRFGLMAAMCGVAAIAVSVAIGQQPGRGPFDNWDKNHDGFLSREEFPSRLPKALFDRIDADRDGRISRKEDDTFRARQRPGARRPRIPENVRVDRDIVYAKVGQRELLLDLYRPEETSGPLPVVLWVHGGGWQSGSKDSPGRTLPLVARGYAVASVGYRLSGEATFPAAVEDCQAAVRWVRANAAKYGLDPDHIGVWGSSAGGHLVAMLGTCGDVDTFVTDANRDQSSRVQAVCDWFGPTDMSRMSAFPGVLDHDSPNSPESRFLGGPVQENKEKVAKANPITYVSPNDPPFLIMHGDADPVVPYNQSELLLAALKKAGVEATLYCVKGGGHGFGGATDDTPESLFEMVAQFFDKHLKPAQPKRPAGESSSRRSDGGQRRPGVHLGSMLRPVPKTAVLAQDGFCVWGASMVRTDDGVCHLLYCRWPGDIKNWITESEIAYATADSPLGPYHFQGVALGRRDARFWDGVSVYNPQVICHKGKYYLYYTGNNGDIRIRRDDAGRIITQRIGVAVADHPAGPWNRMDKPLLDVSKDGLDSSFLCNPAVTQTPAGRWLMVYKCGDGPREGNVYHSIAEADTPAGPFVRTGEKAFAAEGERFPAEDPFIWYEGDRYYAVLKDMRGAFSGVGTSLVQFESTDGHHWVPSNPVLVSKREIDWQDGTVEDIKRLERPQIWFDKGVPRVLFAAVYDTEDRAYNVHIPLAPAGGD